MTHFAEELLPSNICTESAQNVGCTDYDTPSNGALPEGHTLSGNKACLLTQMQNHQLPDALQHLLMAMAMQETNHLDVRERDASKDNTTNKSKNATCFNLSQDLIEKSGWLAQPPRPGQYADLTDNSIPSWTRLNSDAGLWDAVGILKFCIQEWGVEDTLAFVRKGGDAFDPCDPNHPAGARGWWRVYCAQRQYTPPADSHMTPEEYKHMVWNDVTVYLGCIKKMLHYIDDDSSLMTSSLRPNIYCPHLSEPGIVSPSMSRL